MMALDELSMELAEIEIQFVNDILALADKHRVYPKDVLRICICHLHNEIETRNLKRLKVKSQEK